MEKPLTINWYATLSEGQGYSGSSEQTALALDARPDTDIRVASFNKVPRKHISKAAQKLKAKPFELGPVGLVHGLPIAFSSARMNGIRAGYTMFETDKLPVAKQWVGMYDSAAESINDQLDVLFVPSQYCVDLFRRHGVDIPIEVVPNGVNPEHFPFIERPVDRKPFTFLMMATLTIRKNSGMLISAFAKLFGDNPDARLVLKTQSGTHGHVQFTKDMGNIEIIDDLYSGKQMRELMGEADCFVFPSRGEGFGMPPLEAMATGLPTIIAGNTGMLDYSDDRYNYTIRHSHMAPAIRYPKAWGDCGNWFEPDYEHLKELMLHVFNNREEARAKGKAASDWVHDNWNYDVVAEKMRAGIGRAVARKRSQAAQGAPSDPQTAGNHT